MDASSDAFIRPGSKLCIIGAGSIGVYAAKWAIDMGYEPCVFEAAPSVGGVWRQDDVNDPASCHGSAYDSLHTNSSWELMAASDFPFPFKTSGDFPMHHEIVRYVEMYADNFNLWPYIHFNTKVVYLHASACHELTGEAKEWEVSIMAGDAPGVETYCFDAVMIASGQFWSPSQPKFLGQEDFGGNIRHSHLYRNANDLTGKNVLVVGVGNSALDISMEVSQSDARSVRVSSRSGTSVLPVSDAAERPVDRLMSTRLYTYGLPKQLTMLWMYKHIVGTNKTFHDAGLLEQDPTNIQTHFSNVKQHARYCSELACGRISFVPGVKRLSSAKAHFSDGSQMDCDEIICCTGYKLEFQYLDPDLLDGILLTSTRPYYHGTEKTTTWLNAYKHIMHPRHRSLAFLGIVNSFGNEAAVGEMQARWMLTHWSGRRRMPSQHEVATYCKRKSKFHADKKPDFAGFEPYVQYMDDLATDIGCKPNVDTVPPLLSRNASADSALWYSLWMGPNVPSVYRLQGDDSWEHAAQYIKSLSTVKPWHFFSFPSGAHVPRQLQSRSSTKSPAKSKL